MNRSGLSLCIASRFLPAAVADTLRPAAQDRQSLLIAGGTGLGKTALANAILAKPAFARDRVVLIEDTAELHCSAEDRLEMLTKRTEPPVTMTDLVRDTLRLGRDRFRPVRCFKTVKMDYATINGFEVMRALRKGQASAFNVTRDIPARPQCRARLWTWWVGTERAGAALNARLQLEAA